MKTKIAATLVALACVASIGFASANELSVADTTGDTGTPFAMLEGIETSEMSVQEMAATRGAAVVVFLNKVDLVDDPEVSRGATAPTYTIPTGKFFRFEID